mgnify:CR=1 FL=1
MGLGTQVLSPEERLAKRLKRTRARVGHQWTGKELRALLNRFDRGLAIDQMADFHKRAHGGIINRLVKLHLIEFKHKMVEDSNGFKVSGYARVDNGAPYAYYCNQAHNYLMVRT